VYIASPRVLQGAIKRERLVHFVKNRNVTGAVTRLVEIRGYLITRDINVRVAGCALHPITLNGGFYTFEDRIEFTSEQQLRLNEVIKLTDKEDDYITACRALSVEAEKGALVHRR
jgi:hypothetical protein